MISKILVSIILIFACSVPALLCLAAEAIKDDQTEFVGFKKVEYKADEFRDPFRAPATLDPQEVKDNFTSVAAEIIKPLPTLKIQGVIWGGDIPLAIINDKVLKVGDSIEDCKITEINKQGVSVFFSNKKHTFPLSAGLKGGINE